MRLASADLVSWTQVLHCSDNTPVGNDTKWKKSPPWFILAINILQTAAAFRGGFVKCLRFGLSIVLLSMLFVHVFTISPFCRNV